MTSIFSFSCRARVFAALAFFVCVGLVRAAAPVAGCTAAAAPGLGEFSAVDIPAAQIDAAVAYIDKRAEALRKSAGIPGMAVAVVRDGRIVFAKGYGVRSLDTGMPVDADTVFQLASVSKSIGATVIAHQVSAGVVAWDTPVRKPMPYFELHDPYVSGHVTIGDLYAHRSGLPDHAGDSLDDLGFDRAWILDKLHYLPLAPFRASYAYTNLGMTAAAEAVAHASGADWATLSEHVLYAPLGMRSTSSRLADFLARSNRAVAHVLHGNVFVTLPWPQDTDATSPAAGVSSSADDMALWMNLVLADGCVNGMRLIAENALLPALSPQNVAAGPANSRSRAGFYGYGFFINDSGSGRVVLSHGGAFALGASTGYTLIPSAHVGIVTLTNALPVGVPETLNAEFADLVQFGHLTQDWARMYAQAFKQALAPIDNGYACAPNPDGGFACAPPPGNPAHPLADYVGMYASDFYGRAWVSVADNALVLHLGPQGMPFHLTHWDRDVFLMDQPAGSAMPGSRSPVAFAHGTMTIEYMNEGAQQGLGVFRRDMQGLENRAR